MSKNTHATTTEIVCLCVDLAATGTMSFDHLAAAACMSLFLVGSTAIIDKKLGNRMQLTTAYLIQIHIGLSSVLWLYNLHRYTRTDVLFMRKCKAYFRVLYLDFSDICITISKN